MIVNLIKIDQMFSLMLPVKANGQYWLRDLDEKNQVRDLVSIEADNEEWYLKANKKIRIYDAERNEIQSVILVPAMFLYLRMAGSDEKIIIFTEEVDKTRQTLTKIIATAPSVFSIGRNSDNNLYFNNQYVSGDHAKLFYDGEKWSIEDEDSTNGTYVNGYRVQNKLLKAGDYIYILGLRIVIGLNYIAINNPDEELTIRSDSLAVFRRQVPKPTVEEPEFPEKEYFYRSPRFHREMEHETLTIDPPPQPEKLDTVPLALMLGPALTMAMTSVSTAIISVMNVIANNGRIL